ncbi:MAG: hypothetical protein HOP22_07915 [Nitrospiraceae bacterium]|nr:hypothetical protein [Nitrospiraceae bacterium]
MSGQFAYNTWKPGAAGFPKVGETYTDPVFGGTVRRLTDRVGLRNQEDIYAHHWANANGTLCFSRIVDPITNNNVGRILSIATGQVVYDDQPGMGGLMASDIAWDAMDPNVYYYYNGASLIRRNLGTKPVPTDTVIKTFPFLLRPNGGSLNSQDRTGRYFTVRYGLTNGPGEVGTNKIWDSQTPDNPNTPNDESIYSGEVTPLSTGGWVAITPDGNYLVTAAGPGVSPQIEHWSYKIDHATQAILPTPTQFWGLCGDHGVLISASNGKNYFITHSCNSTGANTADAGTYRVDITLDQSKDTTGAQQIAANQLLVPGVFLKTVDGHFSAVSKGPNQDWVFADYETFVDDPFNGTPSGWVPYEQEIVAINVITLEVRRYAHHRSQGLVANVSDNYYAQPRISCSWDGSVVLWTSNFNIASPVGYSDLYAMPFQ